MKKIFIAFVAVACALSACSDDDTADDLSRATISITPDAIPAGPDGTTTQVTVTSSGDWRLAGVCDWVHPSAESGRSGDVVTFTIDPNTSEESREAAFKFFTGSAVAPLKIISEAGNTLTLLSEESMTIEALSADIQVKLHTNIPELDVAFSDGGGEWVTYVGRNDAFGNTVLNFTVAKNPDYDDRSTVITVSGMGQSVDIPLTQRQIDAINMGDEGLMFDLAERTISIDVESNVAYQVTISGNWITQVPETRGLVTKTLRFHLAPATVSRSGKITISGAGITKVVSIVQKDPDAVVVTIADKVFRNKLVDLNWLLELSDGVCVVTEDGLNATEFTYRPGSWDDPILSLEGIEIFANLEKIDVYNNKLTKIDISKLTKVNSLNIDYNGLSEIVLGDNAVEELNFSALYHQAPDSYWDYIVPSSLTVSGTHLKTLKVPFSGDGGWWGPTDVLASIDVSGCPALETLDAVRNAGVLKTIYLKQGQVSPNLTCTSGAEIVYK